MQCEFLINLHFKLSIDKAILHGLKSSNIKYDAKTNEFQLYPLTATTQELAAIGIGIALYFDYMVFLFFIFANVKSSLHRFSFSSFS